MNPEGPKILGGTTVVREPVGVVSGITGYSLPFLLNLAKIVPALLAGNTRVLKPSPFTVLLGAAFGEIAEEIGLPAGVLNVLTGGPDVGLLLTTDPSVDLVSFTGSEQVGAAIMAGGADAEARPSRTWRQIGADRLRRRRHPAGSDERGRDSLGQLRARVRTGHAAAGSQFGAPGLRRNGEGNSGTLEDRASGRSLGDDGAADPGDAAREGRTVHSDRPRRGRPPRPRRRPPAGLDKGFFTELTLFDDVRNDMTIAQEEIFGPVGAVIGFDTDEEAIAITNDSR